MIGFYLNSAGKHLGTVLEARDNEVQIMIVVLFWLQNCRQVLQVFLTQKIFPVFPAEPAWLSDFQGWIVNCLSYMPLKIFRSSLPGFTKGKPCLTNLKNFLDEKTGLVDEVRAVDVPFL